jgi:CRP-like cAMP-binding protein
MTDGGTFVNQRLTWTNSERAEAALHGTSIGWERAMSLRRRGSQTGNHLLDRLPELDRSLLLASGETVSLPCGYAIYEQDGPMSHVYFPTSGVCSILVLMEEGREIEAAPIGREGMLGAPLYLGLSASPVSVMGQIPGEGLRVPAKAFLRAAEPGGRLDAVMRRYIAYLLRQAHQTVACNALHSVEERACRWLLMTRDRTEEDEFRLTHESLATMLGVRRQTVTAIAGTLERAGLIAKRRGRVRVLDRKGLEAMSCECYALTNTLYRRLID